MTGAPLRLSLCAVEFPRTEGAPDREVGSELQPSDFALEVPRTGGGGVGSVTVASESSARWADRAPKLDEMIEVSEQLNRKREELMGIEADESRSAAERLFATIGLCCYPLRIRKVEEVPSGCCCRVDGELFCDPKVAPGLVDALRKVGLECEVV